MRTAKAAAAAAVGDGEGKARLAHGKGGRGLSHVGLVFFSLVWRGGGGGAGVLRENCEPVVIGLHIARPRALLGRSSHLLAALRSLALRRRLGCSFLRFEGHEVAPNPFRTVLALF